jgi:hypothetical protein
MTPRDAPYGLLAEFETDAQVLEAVRRARRAGYREMDAYTPYPVKGLASELGMRRNRVPLVVLTAGIVGAAVGYGMQYYALAVDYPMDSGGRPPNSWPAFIPVTFEVMILVASFAALLGMLFLNGLPQPHHPLFKVERFVESNSQHFFLCLEAADPQFDREATGRFLADLGSLAVMEVPS